MIALVRFMRLTAVLLLAAAIAVVLPYGWLDAAHQGLGLGVLPEQPTVLYLARSLSVLYACLGACYWYASRDVRRYLPLLRFSMPVTLVFTATLIGIDLVSEMPVWWTVAEGAFLAVWTLTFTILLWRVGDEPE